MRKWKILTAFSLVSMLVIGCTKAEESGESGMDIAGILEETETTKDTKEEHFTPVRKEHDAGDGKVYSYLTGNKVDATIGNRRPIAVMIPNNKAALPQYGISKASVIYEACVEGRITRLMGIFEEFDELDHIGPVRSSRDYYVYTAMEFDAIYCHWGLAVPYVADLLNSDKVDNISQANQGIKTPTPIAFERIKRPGYATEYTGYLFIDKLKEGVEKRGYSWNYEEDITPKFTFAADGACAEYNDKPEALTLSPGTKGDKGGYGGIQASFVYDAADGLYYRYQYGTKQIDELDGSQLAVRNVVFQYCHGEVRDNHDYLAFGVHGEGNCIVFTNGKMVKGHWRRWGGDNTPAKYYDEDGQEIIFNQGKTWICNIWQEYGESVLVDGRPVVFEK